jgi:glycosyltransferase involved in cell wall biosynthesis
VRLLHVHSGNIFGGIETMLVTMAQEAGRFGDDASYAALCYEGRLADDLAAAGVQVSILGPVRLSRPSAVRAARARLSQLLRDVQPDVVIMHLPWTEVVFGGVVARLGYPLVVWMHGPAAGWLSHAAALRRPDGIICNSAFTASSILRARRSVPHAIIRYPSPLSASDAVDSRQKTRRDLQAAEAEVIIVQASRFDRWKGHEIHLRAVAPLREVPGWTLWIVGGPQRPTEVRYEHELRNLAAHLGISHRVKFLGQRGDVGVLFAAADVYCQPNTEPEPFGLAYVEALAAGLPVITSDFGGAREIVTSDTGILVPSGNAIALESALRRLIADPAERTRLGKNGPIRARELCDPRRQLDLIREHIQRVLSFARRPRRDADKGSVQRQ